MAEADPIFESRPDTSAGVSTTPAHGGDRRASILLVVADGDGQTQQRVADALGPSAALVTKASHAMRSRVTAQPTPALVVNAIAAADEAEPADLEAARRFDSAHPYPQAERLRLVRRELLPNDEDHADVLGVPFAPAELRQRVRLSLELASLRHNAQRVAEAEAMAARLIESEARFRTLANTIPQLAWMARPDGQIFWFNRRWTTFTGESPENLEGWRWLSVQHPEHVDRVLARYRECLAGGADGYEDTFPLRRHDGEYRWHLTRAVPLRDAGGNIVLWFGTNTDVTEQRRTDVRDRFLVTIDDAVRPLTDPEQIIATSARLLGEHLEVDRCAYAEIEPDQDTMNLTGNWCRHPDIRSIVGRMTFTSFGSQVLQLMRDDEAYIVNDIDTHRPPVHDRTAYRATQIQAVICVPLHKAGRFVAAMAVHTQAPRVWRSDEVELVLTVANRCWEAIERARINRTLIESERRLGLAQRAAHMGVFEWFITQDRIVWSPELEALYGMPTGSFGGRIADWSDRAEPTDAARVLNEVEQALAARRPTLTYEFRARVGPRTNDPTVSLRWFAGHAMFIYDAATRQPLRMVGVNFDIDDRKRAADELDDARRRLEATLGAAEVGTFDYDVATDRTVADRNLARIFGFEVGANRTVFKEDLRSRLHPDDLSRHLEILQAALAGRTGDQFQSEFRVVRPDGSIRWLSARGKVERDPTTGKPTHMPGVALDVTARRGAEQMLRASEERYRSLVQASAQVVWTADPDGDLSADAITWGTYTGQTPAQFARRGWLAAVHPDDRDAVADAWHLAFTLLEPFEAEFRLRRASDNTYRRVISRGIAVRNADGTAKEWVGTVTDVEDQRRAADALAQSEARFRQLADSLPMLTWTAQPDGTITWFNRRWSEYTGLSSDQLLDETIRDGAHHPDYVTRVREAWRHSTLTGEPFDMEFPLRAADGTFRMFLSRGEPLRDASGRIVQWIGTSTDIEQKRQLLDAERTARTEAERVGRMKDEFLATLSHELRTPLNAILGWAQLLQRGTLKEAELRPAIATIERNARAQTQMIEDLLDMSRIVSGKVRLDVQRVDLADVVAAAMHAVEPTAAGRNVRLERILDSHAGPVNGDAARLQQVIWNLLSNSIKFTPPGGKVQVVLERVNSHLELSVSDTGIGIKPEFLPFVFDRFRQADASSTRKYGGLGLGLSIVRQLVELHGGSVRAKSLGENQGTTFIVALPLAATDEQSPERTHPGVSHATPTLEEPSISLAGLTVLVVDDEADARALVKRLLEERSANVLTAPGADEAVRLIDSARPDVLLSDIGMPDVDGYELIRRVRALGANHGGDVPAVALTAFARTEDRRRALLAGFQSHVAKPTEAAELIAVVASVTGRTGGAIT